MKRATAYSLGVDIGGGTTRVALVNAEGAIVQRCSAPTPAGGDAPALAAIIEEFTTALREAHAAPGEVGNVIGVALPGLLDREAGVVHRAVNLPALQGVALRDLLEERLRYPVYLDTDVIAAGFAQQRAMAAHNPDAPLSRFVYLSLGTGIGGAVLLQGRILRHTRGGAGHLGHLIVDGTPDAPECRCGARGCLEQMVCGPLRGEAIGAAGAHQHPDLAALARPLALGMLQISHLYAPTTIAVGGGVIEHHPRLFEHACAMFEMLRSQLVPAGMQLLRAPLLSDDAGAIGAALLTKHTVDDSSASTDGG